MIKQLLLIAGLLSLIVAPAQDYTVTYSSSTYSSLEGGTTIDESTAFDVNGFAVYEAIPIGFEFDYLGATYTELNVAENGYFIFAEGGALTSFISAFDCDLKDYLDDPEQSPIIYTVEGPVGDRIFKCEFQKAGFEMDEEGSDFCYFQLWLYENCSDFEFRIGQLSIDPTEDDLFWPGYDMAIMGYGQYVPLNFYLLGGDPVAPNLFANTFASLNEYPTSGSNYRFSNCEVGVKEADSFSFNCYPNPTSSTVQVQLENADHVTRIDVVSLNGQLVKEWIGNGNNFVEFDLSDLTKGIYFIRLTTHQYVQTKKIILQ